MSQVFRTTRRIIENNQSPRWRAGLVAFIALIIIGYVWYLASNWYQNQLIDDKQAEVALEVSLRGNVLSSILTRRFARLQGLYAYTLSENLETSTEDNFEAFVSTLAQDSTGIRYLAIAPGGVMLNVYPRAGNESLIGYTPLGDPRPEIRADALRAIETGEIIVSGPVISSNNSQVIILRQAVYKENSFWGFVNLAVDLPTILEESGLNNQSDGELIFAIRDGRGRIIFGSPKIFESDPVLNTVDFPEGVWEIAAVPINGWRTTIVQPYQIFQASGLIIVILLVSLVYLITSRQAVLALDVQSRTIELSKLNRQLQKSHQNLEKRVQSRTIALSSLLDISYHLTQTLNLPSLLDVLLDKLDEFTGFKEAAILLSDEGQLPIVHQRGDLPPIIEPIENRDVLWELFLQSVFISPIRNTSEGIYSKLIQPAHSPSWLCIPLKLHDKLIGMIVLSHDLPNYYSTQDEQLVMVMANQAAVSIQNARLYNHAQNLAILQERQRLARELHDSVSQALYGVALGTKTALALFDKAPEKAIEPLKYVLSLSEAASAEMRALIFELRPESLEKDGLIPALERQAEVLRTRFNLKVITHWGEEPPLPLPVKEVLYRVVQEASNNTLKHAAATQVTIGLTFNEDQVMLTIEDNGKGFDVQDDFPGHLGLRSMKERTEGIGGSIRISSEPGVGTRIICTLPIWG